MKKILLGLTLAISCLGISSVKAADLQLELYGYDDFIEFKSFFGNEKFNEIINDMITEYTNNYSSYPYFDIVLTNDNPYYALTLNYYKEIPSSKWFFTNSVGMGWTGISLYSPNSSNYFQRIYYLEDNDFKIKTDVAYNNDTSIIRTRDGRNVPSYDIEGAYYRYYPYEYYYSNYDLILPPISEFKNKSDSWLGSYGNAYIFDYDRFMIPKLDEPNIHTVVSYDRDDFILEPYYLYDTDVDIKSPSYTEINLNDYAYVALALKDYNQEPFSTSVQVKGQYCITPLYDFGLKSYDSITNTKVQNVCSPYYDVYTPIRTYITEDNLKNNAIYYIKAYDNSKENYIKVDNNIFDVSYITEENKNNPYVTVNGKTYPTIPYDELPSSATQNTEEGYVPGQVEEFSFSDIFTAPLEFLQDIWNTIATFFVLITNFISLLPPPLQGFFYSSFTLAIVLGIVKILL